MKPPKAIFCWSGGKDSSYCLHKVLTENLFDVQYLLTTVNSTFKRISMHGVREDLLDIQVKSIGIPLLKVYVKEGTNAAYEQQMELVLRKVKAEGIENVIFGDIFLEDLRTYRENNLAKIGMKAIFPLWKINTTTIIKQFIQQQFKTVLCCINDGYLHERWVGREIDKQFLKEIPDHIDPCGEIGEYHTFCYDGPIFKNPINFCKGENIYKAIEIKITSACTLASNIDTKGFWYCDLIPY